MYSGCSENDRITVFQARWKLYMIIFKRVFHLAQLFQMQLYQTNKSPQPLCKSSFILTNLLHINVTFQHNEVEYFKCAYVKSLQTFMLRRLCFGRKSQRLHEDLLGNTCSFLGILCTRFTEHQINWFTQEHCCKSYMPFSTLAVCPSYSVTLEKFNADVRFSTF